MAPAAWVRAAPPGHFGASANAIEAKTHQHRPILTHEVRRKIHGSPRSNYHRFQVWVAMHFARVLSSGEFLWLCIFLDLLEIPALVGIWRVADPFVAMGATVTYLTQTVIQLVALPVLGEQARLKEEADDARELEQTRTLNAIHKLSRDVHEWTESQNEILETQNQVLEELRGRR